MKKLTQYIDYCTDLLLEELVGATILKVVNKGEDNKPRRYKVEGLIKSNVKESSQSSSMPGVISDFYDFRNIISNTYRHIKTLSPHPGNNPNLSTMVDGFVKLKVIDPPWINNEQIRRFFDKAEDLLADEQTKEQVLTTLKSNKVNFTPLIITVLEYFTQVSLESAFQESIIKTQVIDGKKAPGTPDFIVNVPEANPYLLINVKYRKSKVVLRDIIDQGLEQLKTFNERSDHNYTPVFVVYFSGQLGDKERLIFSFKQNLEKRRSKNGIFFVPVPLGYIENLVTDLTALKDEVLHQTTTNFLFKNQLVNANSPTIDDHYFGRALDLQKNNIEIRVKSIQSGHWRFGVKFSQTDIFPGRDERHPMNHPLIHLQKEADKDAITMTYYDESGSNHHEVSTTISRYKNESIIIKIYREGDELLLNALDELRKPIIDKPFSIGPYNYCWISAWADNRNSFEFETQIIEYAKS